MKELRACLAVSGAFLLAALFGAAPPARAQQDPWRATPPPGKTLMFVFRSDGVAVAARVPVFVNSVRVGELANGSFVVATVNPGKILLRLGDQAAPTYAFEGAANQSYFARIAALAGVQPVRTEVRLVRETEARSVLAQSRFFGATTVAAGAPPPPAAAAPPRSQPPAAPVAAAPRVEPPPAARPTARETAPSTESGDQSEVALIVSGGTFKMANDNPTVAGLPSDFTKTSSPVLSVEAEWRSKAGFAVGGEAFYYKNDLTTNPGTVAAAVSKQQVIAIMANGKYYFRATDWLYPFVGAGIGLADAVYSGGNLKGSGGGPAYQGLAGMEFRFGSVGVHLQYKYLAATAGKSDKQVKVGGGGVLAGVSFLF
jgi:opacity protein-like surface antigen